MISFNHRSAMSYIFAFVDAALVLSAVIAAFFVNPGDRDAVLVSELHPVIKIMLVVAVVELTLYYLDLMDLKVLRHRIRTGVQLLKVGVSIRSSWPSFTTCFRLYP
ncbi:MAG: hypothetical protein GXY78_04995 [Deltaproteobacteria bacterium]|nr:hypothetical protein [Deltaproteobacteria bacterium]